MLSYYYIGQIQWKLYMHWSDEVYLIYAVTTPWQHADRQCNEVRVSYVSSCRNKSTSRPKDSITVFIKCRVNSITQGTFVI